ncbi:MAG: hypothetical protein HRU15_15075, partial [Planctomycetes bacterium]|nr:hypothetical protein [Planctomycetota bacterium]
LRYLFGYLSRACERQADIHGAHLASSEAMCSALLKVSHAVGQDPQTPNWRHWSIAQRIQYLQENDRSVSEPRTYGLHIMKLSTFIIIGLLIILTFSMVQNTRSVSLEDMRKESPRLNQAINSAAEGNSEELFMWLAQCNEYDRIYYLKAARSELTIEGEDKSVSKEKLLQRFYLHKYLFLPFVNLSLGRPESDLELDNMIGYALVAGTDTPQESDITHAKTVLTRLEASVAKTPNVQYLDTIGCIHFTIGDYEKSLEAFRACLKNLKESSLKDHEKKELFQLVSKRVKAAEEKSKSLPLEWKTES